MTPQQQQAMKQILAPHAKKIIDGILDGIERCLRETKGQLPDTATILSLLAEVAAVTLGMTQLLAGDFAAKITATVLERAAKEVSRSTGGVREPATKADLFDMPKITTPGNGSVN